MSQIPWLEDNNFKFPEVSTALSEPDGLLAASERLTPELVIEAYRQGIFPWYSEGQPVLWWSPNPRCVFYPEKFHISRSFKRTLNNKIFDVRTNTEFKQVMQACAAPRVDEIDTDGTNNRPDNSEPGTWITQTMIDVYCQLHEAGFAHSIECWHKGKLVGGMYGLVFGDMFFGESMFSEMKDASKVALHHVCTVIKPSLLDAQVSSKHLHTLGAEVIERQDFIDHINSHRHLALNVTTGPI
ncbi:MAG: leucyl/phenylalanyl-tRNA--protein transferase [Gammaproteobacteria bacterium]